ncbi:MAG: hypothetical protein ACFB4J_17655 [Elainellaceae cyanobacterium]
MTTGLQQPQVEWGHAENMTCPYCKGNRIVHQGSYYKCITPGCSYSADADDGSVGNSGSRSGLLAVLITVSVVLLLL